METKLQTEAVICCGLCWEVKPVSEFHRQRTGHIRWCKACRKDYDAAYYRQHRQLRVTQARERTERLVKWMRQLKQRPCADCGQTFHPAAMAFDHLPGTNKRADIATLAKRGRKSLLLAEIEKCEVVCTNCHAVRTYERREQFRRQAA